MKFPFTEDFFCGRLVKKMTEITPRQKEVLDFIIDFIDKNLYPPTVREVANHFNVAIKAAQDHILALKKKGYLTVDANHSRSISVVHDANIYAFSPFFKKIPCLAKNLSSGEELLSSQNIVGNVIFSEPVIQKDKNYFYFTLNDFKSVLAESFESKNFSLYEFAEKNIVVLKDGNLLAGKIISFENDKTLLRVLSFEGNEFECKKSQIVGIVVCVLTKNA